MRDHSQHWPFDYEPADRCLLQGGKPPPQQLGRHGSARSRVGIPAIPYTANDAITAVGANLRSSAIVRTRTSAGNTTRIVPHNTTAYAVSRASAA